MIDTRYILRAAYDGNYENAIRLLVEIIEKQQKEIEELKQKFDPGEDTAGKHNIANTNLN